MSTDQQQAAAEAADQFAVTPGSKKKKPIQTIRLPSGLIATVRPGKAKDLMLTQRVAKGEDEAATVFALVWVLTRFRWETDEHRLAETEDETSARQTREAAAAIKADETPDQKTEREARFAREIEACRAAVAAFVASVKPVGWSFEDLTEQLELEDSVRLQTMVLGGNFMLPPALTSPLSSTSGSSPKA